MGKFVGFGLGFLVQFAMAGLFGAELVGRYAIVMAIATLLGTVGGLGLDGAVVRFAPGEPMARKVLLVRTAVFCSLVCSTLLAAVVVLAAPFLARSLLGDAAFAGAFRLGGALLVAHGVGLLLSGCHRALDCPLRPILVQEVLQRIGVLVALAVVHRLGGTELESVLLVFVASSGFGCLVLAGSLSRRLSHREKDLVEGGDDVGLRVFFGFASKMLLNSGLRIGIQKSGTLILGAFLEASLVGIFHLTSTLASMSTLVMTASNQTLPTIYSRLLKRGSWKELQTTYGTATRIVLILTLPAMLVLGVFGQGLLQFVDDAFSSGHVPLLILCGGLLSNIATGSTGHLLRLGRRENLLLADLVLLFMVTVLANLALVPRFGVVGAALAVALSQAALNLLMLIQVKSTMRLWPYELGSIKMFIVAGFILVSAMPLSAFIHPVVGSVLVGVLSLLAVAGTVLAFQDDTDKAIVGLVRGEGESGP